MEKITKLHLQITAINKKIEMGKAKNIFAAKNKIKTLKNQIYQLEKLEAWNNHLSR